MDGSSQHGGMTQASATRLTLIELDFETKRDRVISLADVPPALATGRFVWIDVEAADEVDARTLMRSRPI